MSLALLGVLHQSCVQVGVPMELLWVPCRRGLGTPALRSVGFTTDARSYNLLQLTCSS